MKKFILIALLLVAVLEAKVITKTSTRAATGEGEGASREEAVNNALSEALGKLNGINISSIKATTNAMISDNKGQSINESMSTKIDKITKGRADSYKILKVFKEGNTYHASVEVFKSKTSKYYKNPGLDPSSRRSISVFNASFDDFGKIGSVLQQDIINELTKSRKFNVLDRKNGGFYAFEKELIKSGDAHSDELYKLGRVLGSDYFLIFKIQGLNTDKKRSNLTGKESYKSEISISYRVILFATRQVKFSNSINTKLNLKDASLINTASALKSVAKKISNEILGAIYPPRINSFSGQEALFTQSLEVGSTYECYHLGKRLIDNYTKESVGREEIFAGKLSITRAGPKMSYAKVLEGKLKVGDLCRLEGSQAGANVGREANYQLNESGGVSIGF